MTNIEPYPDSRAILIGVSTYQDREYLDIPAADNTLKAFQKILTDPAVCGWPVEQVSVLPNPVDNREIAKLIRRFAQRTRGVLLLYYVGHGILTTTGELCLSLADTDSEAADLTGLEYARVRSAFLDSPARAKVAILDCCYSGRAIEALAGQAGIADQTDVRGVYTLTASDYAAHVPPLPHQADAYTSFTGELLELLREGMPGWDDILTLDAIFLELRRRLLAKALPVPNQRGTDTVAHLGFARNLACQANIGGVLHEHVTTKPIRRDIIPLPRFNRRTPISRGSADSEVGEHGADATISAPASPREADEAGQVPHADMEEMVDPSLSEFDQQAWSDDYYFPLRIQRWPNIAVGYSELAEDDYFTPASSTPGTLAYRIVHLPRRVVLSIAACTPLVIAVAAVLALAVFGGRLS